MNNLDYDPAEATILIVDDKEQNRQLLHDRLARDGYDLVMVESGEEALVLSEGLQPDLVLLDVMMPGMDGFEVCRRLRANSATREIPVIMVTALADTASRLNGLEVGADEFLTKPVDLFELDVRVRNQVRFGRSKRLNGERAKFEQFAKVSSDACLITDNDGRVRYHNPRAAEFLPGLAKGESLSTTVAYLGATVMPRADWRGALPNNSGVNLVLRQESGQLLWIELREHPLNPPIPDQRFFIMRDLTETVEKRKSIWSFHSVLAHKFRTPLTGIIGTLELLELDVDDDNKVLMEGLTTSAYRLRGQIESILEYVEGKDRLTGREGATNASQILEIFAELAAETEIDAHAGEADSLLAGATVAVHGRGWRAVFAELLRNTSKFASGARPHVELNLLRAGDQCQVVYLDDGTSIPEDKLAQVTKPYFQAEQYFTGECPGMGLGLSMIAAVAAEAGGVLTVANREGSPGVKILLELPLTTGAEARSGMPSE